MQPAYLGARPLQREAPTGTIQIPKTGESWIVKVETDRESANQDVSRAKPLKATPRRALVVENEPALRALIQEVLESADVEVVTPAKGTENELHFDEGKFDVVLIGLGTPSVYGIELVRQIRKSGLNRKTPIILLSDDQSPGALSRGFEAGASFFVYKPIDKAHLKRLIHVTQGTIEHERRRFRRVPLRVKVRIKSDKAVLLGEMPLGSLIEISLYPLGGSRPIVGLGSVARILNNTQMGLLLDRFPASEIVRLQEYLIPQIAD